VLEAYAAFANNDGTNIFPSKESLGDKAGVNKSTIYRSTVVLLAAGVLVRAKTHTCKTKQCNKGGTHFTSQHGHYTAAYNINLALVQNASVLKEKLDECTRAICPNLTRAKQLNLTRAKRDATLSGVPTQSDEPTRSVLTDGEVSESVSEEGSSLRSSPIADSKKKIKAKPVQVCEQEQEQHRDEEQPEQPEDLPVIPDTDEDDYDLPAHEFRITDEQAAFYDPGVRSSRLGRDLDREEYLVADDLYFDLLPDREAKEEDVVLLAELALEFTAQTVRAAWSYNQRHKNGKLKFFGVPDLAAALRSDNDRCLLNQMRVHDENIKACEKCEGLKCCNHCLQVEDMTRSLYYGNPPADDRRSERFYLHKGCERAYAGI
jgi:predicted transcriptional regulator